MSYLILGNVKPQFKDPPTVIAAPEKKLIEIEYVTSKVKPLEVGVQFMVKSCKIIDGFRFLVLLDNDTWIETSLPIVTKEGTAEQVAEILKSSPPPSVTLKRKIDNYWIVDFELLFEDKKTKLTELLKQKDLAL
jgi:hypothetical protein